eukprot:15456168-Alexandrium_andersonii.AAC.1
MQSPTAPTTATGASRWPQQERWPLLVRQIAPLADPILVGEGRAEARTRRKLRGAGAAVGLRDKSRRG